MNTPSHAAQRKLKKQAKQDQANDHSTSNEHSGSANAGSSKPAPASALPTREPPTSEPAESNGFQSSSSFTKNAEPDKRTALAAQQASLPNLLSKGQSEDPARGSSSPAPSSLLTHTVGPANDPVEDSRRSQVLAGNTHVDWDTDAYNRGGTALMKRPRFGDVGDKTKILLNSHYIKLLKSKGKGKGKGKDAGFYQYTIQVNNGETNRGLIKTVLQSQRLKKILPGGREPWLFDYKGLAWSAQYIEHEFDHVINLGQEPGRASQGLADPVNVVIKQALQRSRVRFGSIDDYMNGNRSCDDNVIDAINLLDHVVRQTPSENYTIVKQSYFERGAEGIKLGKGVEALPGVYQSIRMVEGPERREGTKRDLLMATNVDVSYAPFWQEGNFIEVIAKLTADESDTKDPAKFAAFLSDIGSMVWKDGNLFNRKFDLMRRLKDSIFTVEYEGMSDQSRQRKWKVDAISSQSAKEFMFQHGEDATGPLTSVYGYFFNKGVTLKYPHLPIVKTTRKIVKRDAMGNMLPESNIVYPMELCNMMPNQRYLRNLDENQTKEMVETAIQPPPERLGRIDKNLSLLDWKDDPFLKRYVLEISREHIETEGRILSPPRLVFRDSDINPGKQGNWALSHRRFFASNTAPLRAWGVMILKSAEKNRSAIGSSEVDRFIVQLVAKYKGFGGDIETENPLIHQAQDNLVTEIGAFYQKVKTQYDKRPQMLVFILPNKDAQTYLQIKKSCDCELGVFSQCVQAHKAKKAKDDYMYMANMLMKFNAKLGGTTNIINTDIPKQRLDLSRSKAPMGVPNFGHVPTKPPGSLGGPPLPARPLPPMFIGADVSHPAPGSQASSYAAMTVSMDKTATRYAAAVQTNGSRIEIISTQNLATCLTPLIKEWRRIVGNNHLPDHVFYFRDGVGESRYKELLDSEVKDMKQIFSQLDESKSNVNVKFTVVVAEKRHHVRFFPQGPGADGLGNPLPGTIVDRDVTNFRANDIYLCSHRALKGTARPTHYIMLKDEANIDVDDFQKILYHQCYQYIRSTTAVSLHPAVYYAHLASKRAQAHDRTYDNGDPRVNPDEPTAPGLGNQKPQGSNTKGKSIRASTSNSKKASSHTSGDDQGKQRVPPESSSKNVAFRGSADTKGKQKASISEKSTIHDVDDKKGGPKDPSSESPPDGPPEPLLEMKDWDDDQDWIGYGMWFI
ncbi:MAG: hypothetical protein Q9169_007046 [Polycauliona sp. 2 TL-2023]